MQEKIFSENLPFKNQQIVPVTLAIEGFPDQPTRFEVSILLYDQDFRIRYEFNDAQDLFIIRDLVNASTKISCIALCGISLSGPIYDCYRKSKGNWNKFIKCLKDQKATLGTVLAACLYPCF